MRPWTASGGLDSVRSIRQSQPQMCHQCNSPLPTTKALCVVCGAIVARQRPLFASANLHSPSIGRPSTSSESRTRRPVAHASVNPRRSVSRSGGSRVRERLPHVKGAWQQNHRARRGDTKNKHKTKEQRQQERQQGGIRRRSRRRVTKKLEKNQLPWTRQQSSSRNNVLENSALDGSFQGGSDRSTTSTPQGSSSGSGNGSNGGGDIGGDIGDSYLGGGGSSYDNSHQDEHNSAISQYSEWNFAPAAGDDDDGESPETSTHLDVFSSELTQGAAEWLINIPPGLVYESLDLSTVRTVINMSGWPVRDNFVTGLTRHFGSVIVALDFSGSVQITDRSVEIMLSTTCGSLQSLNLSGCWRITERGFERRKHGEDRKNRTKKRSTLAQLNLSSLPHMDDLVLRTLAVSPYTCMVRRLTLRNCPMLSDSGFGALKGMRYLTAVHVDGCRGLRGMMFRDVLENCHGLIELTASGLPMLTDEAVRAIAARKSSFGYTGGTSGVLELRLLDFSKCRRLTDLSLQWLASKLMNIRAMHLSECLLISDASLNMIARSCVHLQSLRLKNCSRITDAGLIFLAKCLAEHNRHKKEEDCEPASAVAASVVLPYGCGQYDELSGKGNGGDFKPVGLTELDLSGCVRVGDSGIRALANVSKHLRSLQLNNVTSMGDAGLQYVAKHCTQLERIELCGNPRLTDVGVCSLLKKVRRCTLEGRSIGIGKRAMQSTTLAGRGAHFSVDGDASGYYGVSYDDENGKVSHTCQEPNPWLIVDLGVVTDISWVRVVGAAESSRYLQNFPMWIMASELPFNEVPPAQGGDRNSSQSKILCQEAADVNCEELCGMKVRFSEPSRVCIHSFDRPARYLRVQVEGGGPLILAQLQVYTRGTESLSLAGCDQLSDTAAYDIAQYFVHLLDLDLSGCTRMQDDGVTRIIKECRRLKSLMLSGCVDLSDASIGALSQKNGKTSNLQVLGISSCSKVSDRGLVTMASACPLLSKLQMENIPRITMLGLRLLVKCCPLLEAVVLTSSHAVRYNDVERIVGKLKLATPFEMGVVVGCEPRSDVAALRLAHQVTKQHEGLRQACQVVQRNYRRVKDAALRDILSDRFAVDSFGEEACSMGVLDPMLALAAGENDHGARDVNPPLELLPLSAKGSGDSSGRMEEGALRRRQKYASSAYSESSQPYQNAIMFDLAREASRLEREKLRKILELVGKPPRARTIQRCWRQFYKRKVAALKELMRGRRVGNAVKIIVRMQAILRGVRTRLIVQRKLAKKRVARVVADMKSGKINLQSKGLRPAIKREIASIIIQRNARIKIARLVIAQIKLNLVLNDKSFVIIKNALLRKLARIRGKALLHEMKAHLRDSCALRIQGAWRMHTSRRGLVDMRNARLAIESAARAAAQRRWNAKKGMAARRIQKLVRVYIERMHIAQLVLDQTQLRAANVIRRSYIRTRSRKAQARMKILLRFEVRKQVLSAKALQQWYRRRMEIWRIRQGIKLLLLRHVGASIVVQRWMRKYVRPLVLERLGRSATRIQHMFEHHTFRRRIEKMLRKKRLYRELEREEWEEWYEMEAMALRIQQAWRLKCARRVLRLLKQDKLRMEAHEVLINRMNQMQHAMRAFERRDRRKKASLVIQCSIRCALARRELTKRKKAKAHKEHISALKLQYKFRSMIAMRMMRVLQKEVEEKLAKEEAAMTNQMKFQRWKDDKEEAMKHTLQVGDIVKSRWMGKHKYYPGVVKRINPSSDWLEEQSYEVLYHDGFLERRTLRTWIRFTSRPGDEGDDSEEQPAATAAAMTKHTDPIEASFSVVEDAENKRSKSDRIKAWIPFTLAFKTRRQKKTTKRKLDKTQGQHAVYSKQRTSAKIRVGIDDIKIIMGDLANMTMEAEQRTNLRKKRPAYIKVDIDLRQHIRFETDDPMCIFVWYRKTTVPRLICDIKVTHGWELGHKAWEKLREAGYEKAESNTVQPPSDMPTLWSRLPMTIWYKKHVYETPIKDLMFSRGTQTRAQENALLRDGYYQNVQDLKLFGLDHGLQFWMRRAEKFDDAVQLLADTKDKVQRQILTLHDVPIDVNQRLAAMAAGGTHESMDVVDEVVSYLNMKDKDVKKAYAKFCKLAGRHHNEKGDVRVSLDELCHVALGFEYGSNELGTVLHSILELAKVDLIDKQFLDFPRYLKLMSVVCVMDNDQMLRFFFNLADSIHEGECLFILLFFFFLVWFGFFFLFASFRRSPDDLLCISLLYSQLPGYM